MKNIELYRTIEALVKAKKQLYQPNKPSFAQEYCRQQIKKKKLIPSNPSSKMSTIMKNFHQLDTYVDVQQLFESINAKVEQKKKQDIKSHTIINFRSKPKISFNDDEIIKKVRQRLGPYNYKIYMKDVQYMQSFIEYLEQQSNIATFRKHNSSSSDDLNFYIKHTQYKNNNQNNVNKEQISKNLLQSQIGKQKQKWQYYQGNNYTQQPTDQKFQQKMKKSQYKPEIQKIMPEKVNIKLRQQKKQLIHQVSTYLQIILQNQHKKKWEKKNSSSSDIGIILCNKKDSEQGMAINVTNQSGQKSVYSCGNNQNSKNPNSVTTYTQTFKNQVPQKCHKLNPDQIQTKGKSTIQSPKSSGYRVQKLKQRRTEGKSFFDNSSNSLLKSSLNNSTILKKKESCQSYRGGSSEISQFLAKKVGVKQSFTFRNRNIKQNLMKKVEQFLDFVESEEKQFKRQKNSSINQLDYLQNKQYINNNNIGDRAYIVDDHQLKAVQNIVQMQK